ncbi:MAG TPA: hypothetical protein VJB90_02050 [Candidatus Nanoarchaeia archaeon]|nr:hypothetical protein [Candidatus Nanoarchaeia archaeon]
MTDQPPLEDRILSELLGLVSTPLPGEYRDLRKTHDFFMDYILSHRNKGRGYLRKYRAEKKKQASALEHLVESANHYISGGYYSGAVSVLNLALEMQPDNEQAQNMLAEITASDVAGDSYSNYQSFIDHFVRTQLYCELLSGAKDCRSFPLQYTLGDYYPEGVEFLANIRQLGAILFRIEGSCENPNHQFKGILVCNDKGLSNYYPLSLPGEKQNVETP